MLDMWNDTIFNDIYEVLKDKTMILIKQEREGEVFDSQLVIGVRQSFGNFKLKHFNISYDSRSSDLRDEQNEKITK